MSEKKEKLPIHKARGIAVYPWLKKPDTKFDADGVFKTDLRVSEEDAQALIEIITEAQNEAKEEAEKKAKAKRKKAKEADLPYSEALDEDGEETGEVMFRFKSKASGTSKKTGKRWSRTLPLFDAKGKKTKVSVYGGSEIIVAFTAQPWVNPKMEYGVKLQLEAVQIIDLVTGGGGGSASSYGFGEEDGFDASDAEDEEDTETEDEDEGASDEDDDEDADF
jgi:hypothetical protein